LELLKEKDFLKLVVWTIGRTMFLILKIKKIKITKEIMRLITRSNRPLSARKVARIAGLCIISSSGSYEESVSGFEDENQLKLQDKTLSKGYSRSQLITESNKKLVPTHLRHPEFLDWDVPY
jgi:hypothetical protein